MSVEENKKVARTYHEFNLDDIEVILTPGFTGHHPDGSTWDRDSRKHFWSNLEHRGGRGRHPRTDRRRRVGRHAIHPVRYVPGQTSREGDDAA